MASETSPTRRTVINFKDGVHEVYKRKKMQAD